MGSENLKQAFIDVFGVVPLLFKSPGRINIIGEHTDYNGGFVLPAAINKAVYIAISKRADDEIHLYSKSYQQSCVSSTRNIAKTETGWANYILGVANEFVKAGYEVAGFNLYVDGDVPLGSGLSSSAAVECATACALNHINNLGIAKMDLALLSQQAEHLFAGVNCGIMDQFASVFGKKDHAILLDCRSMEYEYTPLNLDGYKLVLLNTNVKHSLSDSAYNNRREQCEQGVAWVREYVPSVTSLRDVELSMLEKYVKPQGQDVYNKCRYVVEEIERVQTAVVKLRDGNLQALGELMFETHDGLSKDYQVSCKELDFLVDQVRNLDFVLGARMMGGGFGGCTINILKDEEIDALIEKLSKLYLETFGLSLGSYVVETADGSGMIS